MTKHRALLTLSLASTFIAACGGAVGTSEETQQSAESPLVAGSNAAGAIPSSLPARLTIGLGENQG